jgi:hypothetical protein
VRAITDPKSGSTHRGPSSANGKPFYAKKSAFHKGFLGTSRFRFAELLKPGIADDIGLAML